MSHTPEQYCFVCGASAPFGFSERGGFALLRWFCRDHRGEGQAYWEQINGKA